MCEEHLKKAKDLVNAASATFAAAPILVLVAIALNGGFFTAPGAPVPMIGAAAAAFAAAALLGRAKEALQAWVICGGVSAECKGTLSNIENMLAAAMTTIGILGGACAGVAAAAWIPWFAQPGMWVVYGALLVGVGTIVSLQAMWGSLDKCQSDVAKTRGSLLPGEKASDPWFLRLAPKNEPRYANPVGTDLIEEDVINHTWLRCRRVGVKEWMVEAVATIKGTPGPAMKFVWTLGGITIPSASVVSDSKHSVLSYHTPALGSAVMLKVEVRDSSGFTRSMTAEMDLTPEQLDCKTILPLIPVRQKSPILEWTPERLKPAVDIFLKTLRDIQEAEIRNGGNKERPR